MHNKPHNLFPTTVDSAFDEALSQTYHDVVDEMEQGILVWSEDGVCALVNKRYYVLTGSSEAEMYPGLSWDTHINLMSEQGHYTKEQADSIIARMAAREIFTVERKSPSGKTLSLVIRPLKNGGHVVSFTDVSGAKRHEKRLAGALERAEMAEHDAQQALVEQNIRASEMAKLSEFGNWLHSCKSLPELYLIVDQAMQNIYPGSSGQLYIYSHSRDVLDGVASWGGSEINSHIQAHDCWSLRRGRIFKYGEGMIRVPCKHVTCTETTKDSYYYCLPLIAHGDTLGLLHIDLKNADSSKLDDDRSDFNLAFTTSCAEQISLAIANAQLRDELHEQSTRDPLTGLFNRRYFLERCRTERARHDDAGSTLGIAVFDADNFKQFNDHYGHDAGDSVLCELADVAHRFFINDEVVARIGGEEFAVLGLNTDSESFRDLLEEFRNLVASMEVRHLNKALPSITVSIGCAMYPEHADSIAELLKAADQAMYSSKQAGKNCTLIVPAKAA